jgi:anti-anti-sigma regulatory factor
MKKSDLLIAHGADAYSIKVTGRANFEYGLPLRNFAKSLENDFDKISIDLKYCTGMDSTFMGVLAMIGLKAKKANAIVEIVNAEENNRQLLVGLGVDKLFIFTKQTVPTEQTSEQPVDWKPGESGDSRLTTAETVVDAHETLMTVDEKNVPKFEKVVEFAQQDLDKLKQ